MTERLLVHRVVRSDYGLVDVLSLSEPGQMRGLTQVAFGFLWLFVFTVAWENLIVLPGVGTIGKVLGAGAFGIGLLAIIDKGHLRRLSSLHALMASFVVWGAFTLLWTTAPDRTREEVGTYFQLLLMVWILHEIASTDGARRKLMSAYVLGSYVSSVFTFLAFQSGATAHYHRYAAQGFNPGDLGLMLVLSVPFGFYLSATEANSVLLWVYRLHPLITSAAILLTAARGALIDLFISMLIIPLSFHRWNLAQKVSLGLIMAACIPAALLFVPVTSWQRFGTIGHELTSGNLNERRDIWKAGLDVFRSHPIEGVGVNAFAPTVQRVLGTPRQMRHTSSEVVELVAHNTFVSVLVEEGLIGFVLFVLILISLWQGALRLDRARRNVWVVVLLVWTVGVMELTWEYRKPTWLMFGLLAAAITSAKAASINSSRRLIPEFATHRHSGVQ
jgi:O-antigen ligase